MQYRFKGFNGNRVSIPTTFLKFQTILFWGNVQKEYIMNAAHFALMLWSPDQTETYYYMNHDHLFRLLLPDIISNVFVCVDVQYEIKCIFDYSFAFI